MRRVAKYSVPVAVGLLLSIAIASWSQLAAAIAGIATVLLTAILVSITWFYADETRILRGEAQVSRMFNQPVIRLTATLTSEPHIVIRNIGQGFAADVSITLREESDSADPILHSLDVPILGPGEGVEFCPRSHVIRSINGFLLNDRSINFAAAGHYTDASGTQHSIDDAFSLSDFINRCEDLGVEFASDGSFQEFLREREQKDRWNALTAQVKRAADAISRIRF